MRAAPWLLLVLAAALRLPRLDLRPLHHDEGTNVIFLLRLLREGAYQYDPSNYHGPLLYFLGVVPLALFGTTTVALRIVPALLGTFMAPLPWLLRREIGRSGALAAGLLLAVSPALVYYSRDAIHEIHFVFLTLALVAAGARGARTGDRAWFAIAGLAAGGLASTKETAVLTFLALGAGLLISKGAGLPRPDLGAAVSFALAAFVVCVALYSDLFSDLAGLARPFQAVRIWGGRGLHADGHGKPWWYFAGLLARDEPAVLLAGCAGLGVALWSRRRFAIFLAAWAAALLVAYSALPYKTPWLVLNVVLPLALLAGVGFETVAGPQEMGAAQGPAARGRRAAAPLAAALLLAGAGASAWHAYDLSFVRYDDERASGLVYVQTRREALRMVSRIEAFAAGRPEGLDVTIEILSPDYLPLNWYLREFTDVGYFGEVIVRPAAPVVVTRLGDADRVAGLLGPGYSRATYPLRPGVDLCLFLLERPRAPDEGDPDAEGRL